MGEWVTGSIKADSTKSSVVIVLNGETSPQCLERLKMLISKWAKSCGVRVGSVTAVKKNAKRKKKK